MNGNIATPGPCMQDATNGLPDCRRMQGLSPVFGRDPVHYPRYSRASPEASGGTSGGAEYALPEAARPRRQRGADEVAKHKTERNIRDGLRQSQNRIRG